MIHASVMTGHSAQPVVLSACETGLGKLSTGDELIGLQRAFLYAGTPAVVTAWAAFGLTGVGR
jgi:CHAT domain-containing protein